MDKKIDNSGIVLRLKEIMKEKKWTQDRFAKETGISVKTIGRWKKNENEPTDDKLEQIAKRTGYTYEWVANLEDQPKYEKDAWTYYNQTRVWGLRGLNSLYERIRLILENEKISPEQLIFKTNINLDDSGQCQNWHFIGDNPSAFNILKICETFGYNKEWLWNGKGKPRSEQQSTSTNYTKLKSLEPPTRNSMLAKIVEIPVLGKVPAGIPNTLEEFTNEYISMPNAPKNCFALKVFGESMEPTFRHDDYVLFVVEQEIKNGDIVVVNDEFGESMIKRYREKDGQKFLVSDNQSYPTYKPNGEYRIMGKVIGAWRQLNV